MSEEYGYYAINGPLAGKAIAHDEPVMLIPVFTEAHAILAEIGLADEVPLPHRVLRYVRKPVMSSFGSVLGYVWWTDNENIAQ